MRIRLVTSGRVLQGTPVQVVQSLRALAGPRAGASTSDYTDDVVAALARDGVRLDVTGATDAERAASLVSQLLRTGQAERL